MLVAALLIAIGTPLRAQGTAPVPLDDPAYAYLDRLEELGMVDSAVMGQRPYSYREMARLARAVHTAADGTRRADPKERALIDDLLARLDARVVERPDPTSALLDDALLAANANNAIPRRPTAGGTNFAPQAFIDPLARRRLGTPPARGKSVALELLQRVEPTSWLAINGRERLDAQDPTLPDLGQATSVLVGGARLRWRNLAVMAGREQLGWGSGERGGLFLAADAPALDQISVASDHPFLLPGFLRPVGPVAGTLVVADLGPSAIRSQSRMLAYKLSARPAPALELGATFQNHFGGEGARHSSFLNQLVDFLPMIDIFRRHNYVDTTRALDVDSDKAIGADVRWRIDRLGGVIVAGEMLVDDFDVQRLVHLLNSEGSHALAIVVPRLGSPEWTLRLTATHMGPLTYTHAALRQGMTTRNRLMGNELGPDAKAFGTELRWSPRAAVRLSLEGQSAIFSSSTYAAGYDESGRWVVAKLTSGRDELRELGIGTLAVEPTSTLGLSLRAGVERTRNELITGATRHTYAVDAGVRWRF